MKKYLIPIGLWFLLGLILLSCDGFLEERPSKSIVVPNTVADLRSIMNAPDIMNSGNGFGLVLSDDLYTTEAGWMGYDEASRNGYIWNMSWTNPNGDVSSWSNSYSRIFRANLVLEESENVSLANAHEEEELKAVKATAQFYRAYHYFDLMQLFSHPIVEEGDLERDAVPLKLTPAINEQKGKSSSGEVYSQIISDLVAASEGLPDREENVLRPSKAACYGLLTRVFLQIGEYEKALEYAEKGLAIHPELLDFNTIPALTSLPIKSGTYPIPRFNPEVIMHIQTGASSFQFSPLTFIDHSLFESYKDSDLRKYLFFSGPDKEGRVNFVGNFSGNYHQFAGITTGELFLAKAECEARLGFNQKAVATLNQFLLSRYLEGSFEPYSVSDGKEFLSTVILERRKELVYRGPSRWGDMRRFLSDPNWDGPSVRLIQGSEYKIGTDPLKYLLDIPRNEQRLNDKL